MKKLLQLKTFAFGRSFLVVALLAMVGTLSAWAEETETITFPTSEKNANPELPYTISGTNVSVSVNFSGKSGSKPATNKDGVRLYPNGTLTFSATNDKKIKSVVITYTANTGGSGSAKATPTGVSVDNGTITNFVSGSSNETNQAATWTAANETTTSFTITVNGQKGNYAFQSAVVTFVEASEPDLSVTTTLTFEPAVYNLNMGEAGSFKAPTPIVKAGEETITPEAGSITYAFNVTGKNTDDVFTDKDGTIAIGNSFVGTIVATATYAGKEGEYKSSTGCYTINVTDPNVTEKEEVIDLTAQGYTNAQTISKIDGTVVSLSFTDGGTATAYYDTGTAVRVYNGGSMKVTASGKTITKIVFEYTLDGTATVSVSPETYNASTKTWTGKATEVTLTVGTAKHARISKVTVTYEDDGTAVVEKKEPELTYSAATATVTLGEEPYTLPTLSNPNGLAVTYTSTTKTVATVDEDGTVTILKEGTTNIVAEFAGNDEYKSGSASYSLTVNAPATPDPEATDDVFYKVTDAATLGAGQVVAIVNEEAGQALSTNQKSKNRGATDVTIENNSFTATDAVQYITLEALEKNYRLNVGEKGYLTASGGNSNNNLTTKTSTDDTNKAAISIDEDGNASIVFQITTSGAKNTLRYNGSDSNNLLFSCYASGQDPIQLYRKAEAVSIGATGYATYYSASALDFTGLENMYAYVAKVDGEDLTFTRVNKVPAETGLLLFNPNKTSVTCNVPVLVSGAEDVTSALSGTLEEISITEGYILNNGSAGVGFYKANPSGSKVGAHRAYFKAGTVAGVRNFGLNLDGQTTGIGTVAAPTRQGIYDLQGRRVNAAKSGLYIVNGKKVLVP